MKVGSGMVCFPDFNSICLLTEVYFRYNWKTHQFHKFRLNYNIFSQNLQHNHYAVKYFNLTATPSLFMIVTISLYIVSLMSTSYRYLKV